MSAEGSSTDTPAESPKRLPFKVLDNTREKKYGLVASSLKELIEKACEKLEVENNDQVKLVLDMDGTEVDDEEYFATLESNTLLMLLTGNQRWIIHGKPRCSIIMDETDGQRSGMAHKLIDRLHSDMSYITMLSSKELELLTDMDPNSVGDFDRSMVEELQEASERFLEERRDAQDAISMLKLYSSSKTKKEKAWEEESGCNPPNQPTSETRIVYGLD